MKPSILDKAALALLILSALASGLVAVRGPTGLIPTHFDFQGQADGWSDRTQVALIVGCLALVGFATVSGLGVAARRAQDADPARARGLRAGQTVSLIVIAGVMGLILALVVAGKDGARPAVLMGGLALIMAATGAVFGRVGPNPLCRHPYALELQEPSGLGSVQPTGRPPVVSWRARRRHRRSFRAAAARNAGHAGVDGWIGSGRRHRELARLAQRSRPTTFLGSPTHLHICPPTVETPMLSLLIASALTAPTGLQTSTDITLPSQPAPLHGTLLTPAAPITAVAVLLPGSGPTDRDGSSPQFGIVSANLRLLAEGLAEKGVATLRIDKRGIGESTAAGFNESALRFQVYADDARAWAAEAATRTGQPCAWLIGHSEGSLVALQAVQTPDDKICGVVSLSGAGRPAGVVLREQLAAVPEPVKTEAFAALGELEAGRTVADYPPQLAALFRLSVQPYLISWLPLDPAALARAYRGPLFIGQGSTDIQVSMADAEALAAARPDATFVRFDGVNHVLKVAPEDRASNLATYGDPNLPLASGVVDAVADFIAAH